MGTCKTCEHWDNRKATELGCGWCGDCTISGPMLPQTAWGQNMLAAFGAPDPNGDMIVTGEDFSCLHYAEGKFSPES